MRFGFRKGFRGLPVLFDHFQDIALDLLRRFGFRPRDDGFGFPGLLHAEDVKNERRSAQDHAHDLRDCNAGVADL